VFDPRRGQITVLEPAQEHSNHCFCQSFALSNGLHRSVDDQGTGLKGGWESRSVTPLCSLPHFFLYISSERTSECDSHCAGATYDAHASR